jgi:hypothetical protein
MLVTVRYAEYEQCDHVVRGTHFVRDTRPPVAENQKTGYRIMPRADEKKTTDQIVSLCEESASHLAGCALSAVWLTWVTSNAAKRCHPLYVGCCAAQRVSWALPVVTQKDASMDVCRRTVKTTDSACSALIQYCPRDTCRLKGLDKKQRRRFCQNILPAHAVLRVSNGLYGNRTCRISMRTWKTHGHSATFERYSTAFFRNVLGSDCLKQA